MKKRILAGLIAGIGLALPVAAQGYLGLGTGSANLRGVDGVNAGKFLKLDGADGSRQSYKLYAGYQITPHWGLELQYSDLGKRDVTLTGWRMHNIGHIEIHQYGVAGTGTLPLGSGFSLFTKIGLSNNHCKTSWLAQSSTDSGMSQLIGIGANYAITPHLAARLEYEDFGKLGEGMGGSSIRIDNLSLNLTYTF
jgi:OOP family OmpA-OmpF porin